MYCVSLILCVWLLPLAIHDRVAENTEVSLRCLIWTRNASLQLFEAVNYFYNKRKNNLLVNANIYYIFIFDSSIWNYVASEPIQFKFSERINGVFERKWRVLREFLLLLLPLFHGGGGKLACFDSTYLPIPCQRAPQLPEILGLYFWISIDIFICPCLSVFIDFILTHVILNSLPLSSYWMRFSVIQLMYITFTVHMLCMNPALNFQH